MSENPYGSPNVSERNSDADSKDGISSSKAAYNIVSDTVTGVNFRGRDNLFQAKFIAASVTVLALVGIGLSLLNADWELPWYGGAMIGGFAGMVIGVFVSGIFLMVYRAVGHIKGKHD
jgi:hypothetical protein